MPCSLVVGAGGVASGGCAAGHSRLTGGVGVRVQEVGLDNAPFRPTGSPGAGHSGLSGQFRKKCVVLSVVECGESARGNQVRVCVCVCVCYIR